MKEEVKLVVGTITSHASRWLDYDGKTLITFSGPGGEWHIHIDLEKRHIREVGCSLHDGRMWGGGFNYIDGKLSFADTDSIRRVHRELDVFVYEMHRHFPEIKQWTQPYFKAGKRRFLFF